MELEDLKSAWKSIDHDIEEISRQDEAMLHPQKKTDAKAGLMNRFYFEITAMSIGCLALATSRAWAPAKMPVWWISAFCLLFIIGIVTTIYIIGIVKRIDLYETPHMMVMTTIIHLKKLYKHIELYSCIAIAALMISMLFIPSLIHSALDSALILIITATGLILESFWYRSNIAKFNEVAKWID